VRNAARLALVFACACEIPTVADQPQSGLGGACRSVWDCEIGLVCNGDRCAPAPKLMTDALPSEPNCDVVAQSGCGVSQKCTWIGNWEDRYVDCAPNGSVAIGGACTLGNAGYDNCERGSVCVGGTCRTICEAYGSVDACSPELSCTPFAYDGYGGVAGACTPACDPLDDNDFLASGAKPGVICNQYQGCYQTAEAPAHWACEVDVHADLVHGSPCMAQNGCTSSQLANHNGCAQGYVPVRPNTSTTFVCVALCKPGNTYLGNPDSQYPAGQEPHRCQSSDARGSFASGEHCAYSWLFERGPSGYVLSPTSDTVGFCIDHSKWRYDSNGDGTIDTNDATWPACATLPDGFGSGGSPGAADFGCVDSTHAGL
jgi:hypothetical protein